MTIEAYLHTKTDKGIANLNRQKKLICIRKKTIEAYLHTKKDNRSLFAYEKDNRIQFT